MADLTENAEREQRQDDAVAMSEALKLRLLAHSADLEKLIAELSSRTENGSNDRTQ